MGESNLDKVRVAALQLLIKSADTKWNRDNALKWIDMAADEGAQIICLPNNWNTGEPSKVTMKLAEPIPGSSTKVMLSKAAEHEVAIVAGGILEKRDSKVYDTSVVIGRKGEILGKHSCTHLHWKGNTYKIDLGMTRGNEHNIFDIPGMCKVGVLLAGDIDPPEPARILALKGAEIIFTPMLAAVIHRNPYLPQGRAKENGVYVVLSNGVGKEETRRAYTPTWGPDANLEFNICEGASSICNPEGDMIAFAGARFNEGIVMATLDLAKIREHRRDGTSALDTRERGLYSEILKY